MIFWVLENKTYYDNDDDDDDYDDDDDDVLMMLTMTMMLTLTTTTTLVTLFWTKIKTKTLIKSAMCTHYKCHVSFQFYR